MKLTAPMRRLICELEYEIGCHCYNPNSYNGYTCEEGCSYRYPVCYYQNEDITGLVKTRGKVMNNSLAIPSCVISTMKYQFGSNHLFIGNALINILNELEKRYDIDFNELEKQRNKSDD